MLRGWAVRSWKGLLSRSVRLPNSPYCFALKESDHIEPSRLCAGPQLQVPVFPHLLLRRSPIATGLLYDLHICACYECVLLIKMTCAMYWIIVRERRADSTSLSHPDLAGSNGKTESGHLELSPDAVDDHDFFCALSCSSMLQNMLLHRHLGRWIIVMISSAPAAEADFI